MKTERPTQPLEDMHGHVPSTSVAIRMSISGLIELSYNNIYKGASKWRHSNYHMGVSIYLLLDILNSRKPNFLAQILYKNPWRKLDMIKSLRIAESCENSCLPLDKRHREVEFMVDNYMFFEDFTDEKGNEVW